MADDLERLREELAALRRRVELLEGKPKLSLVPLKEDRRGRSEVARMVAGASMKARKNGVTFVHRDVCKRLSDLERFCYGVALLGAAMEAPETRCKRAAYVIGYWSAMLDERIGT